MDYIELLVGRTLAVTYVDAYAKQKSLQGSQPTVSWFVDPTKFVL
jgi:hypothetical protein